MRMRSLLLLTILVTTLQVNAQTPPWVIDSVQMGPGYGNDVFYSMKNGSVSTVSNTNWHLGFEMIPGGPGHGGVSIIANHVQNGVKVYSLHLTGTAKFTTLAGPDTMAKTLLYNADSNWEWGAFNRNVDVTNILDYGWGSYDMTTHDVLGDSLYMVRVGAEVYKIVVQSYQSGPVDSISYIFRIAKFDGTNDHTDTLWRKPNYVNKNFAYYDITTNTFLNREPDHNAWDIVFTRYIEPIVMGPGPATPYPVTGALSNVDVKVADVRGVDPDTAISYNAYARTSKMNEIGQDWKTFNMTTFQYDIDTTASFYVQTIDTAIYQVMFTRFESGSGPSGTGKFVFGKRMLAFPATVGKAKTHVTSHTLVPNPANNDADLVIDAKEASDAQVIVTDISGRLVQRNVVSIRNGLNAFRINTSSLVGGIYIVTVTNGSWKISDKLIVQH